MNIKYIFLTLFITYSVTGLAQAEEISTEQQEYEQWAKQIWDSLDRQTGEIKLGNAVATLDVPEYFYFLNSRDAEKVLVDVWGNPPGQTTLGMLFPESMTPFDPDSWAVDRKSVV